jgi:hypothetical protein
MRWATGVLAGMLAMPIGAQQIDWNAAIKEEGKRAYLQEVAANRKAPGLEFTLESKELSPGQLFAWHTLTTIADVASTHYVLARCDDCAEGNPIMKPFVERGPAATLTASALYNWGLWFWRYTELQRGHGDHAKQVEALIRMGSDAHYGASCNNMGILDK